MWPHKKSSGVVEYDPTYSGLKKAMQKDQRRAFVRYVLGVVLASACIAIFVADMVYLHQVARMCAVQNQPGTHHDWDTLLETI